MSLPNNPPRLINLSLRYIDGLRESFTVRFFRVSADWLYMELATGENFNVPVRNLRGFSNAFVDEVKPNE